MSLPYRECRRKLQAIAGFMGFEQIGELLAAYRNKELVPGICTAADCDLIRLVGCDEAGGWCWDCGQETVRSVLVCAALH